MSLAAAIYYSGLRALRVPAISRRLRDAGVILCYHNVVAAEGGAAGDQCLHMPLPRFERQIRWLANHYEVVSLREFTDRLTAGRSLRSVVAVTFDDGYAGMFEYGLPILAALGIPATVFLVAQPAGGDTGFWWDQPEIVGAATPARRERWLRNLRGDGEAILAARLRSPVERLPWSHRPAGWPEILRSRGAGIELGVHSATHRSLPTLTDAELEYEVVTSRAIVQRATGVLPEFFAYPYGHWDPRVRRIVHAAGYRGALALDPGLNGPGADPWALRRVNVPAGISDAAYEAWTASLKGRPTA